MAADAFALARQVAYVAQDLDARGYRMAGVVRQAAQALLELPDAGADGCRGCGAPLPVSTGRPRVWCGEPCRNRARRK